MKKIETGIYISKIEKLEEVSSGTSKHGKWYLFKFYFSFRFAGEENLFSMIEPSWDLDKLYLKYFNNKAINVKEWRQLVGKTVQIYFEEGKKPEIVGVGKQTATTATILRKRRRRQ